MDKRTTVELAEQRASVAGLNYLVKTWRDRAVAAGWVDGVTVPDAPPPDPGPQCERGGVFTEQQRWEDHIRMEQMFYDPTAETGSGENTGSSHRSVRKSLNYRKRAPRCENCVRFEWLPNGGGPNCTRGMFHASPLGICDQWSPSKGGSRNNSGE